MTRVVPYNCSHSRLPIFSQSGFFKSIGASMYLQFSRARNRSRDRIWCPSPACPVNVVLWNTKSVVTIASSANPLNDAISLLLFMCREPPARTPDA